MGRDERPRHGATRTDGRDPDLNVVSDPRANPPRVAMFDSDNVGRWIRADETLLVDLTSIR